MISSQSHEPTVLEIIRAKLEQKKHIRSAEIIPPRNGAETQTILKQIERLKEVPVDFISVTKGAGGSLRGGTLPIAQLIKSKFDLCALAHFTCRDYTVEEIENNLIDHHYFGIHNILALRGDPPDGQPDHFKPAPNRHSYAWQLVDQISKLNSGEYLSRIGFDSKSKRAVHPTHFCIGVAAHPDHEPHEQAIEYLEKKIDLGAKFAITQMIFDDKNYARLNEALARKNKLIPILPGIRIITQAATAERMSKKFGIEIPAKLHMRLLEAKNKEDARLYGLEFTVKLCERLLQAGAPGIHVFVMNDERTAADLLLTL